MFETSYLFEILVSIIVSIAIIAFGVKLIATSIHVVKTTSDVSSLVTILDDAIVLAIGAELIKMLCKHTPETIIEVLAFALARHLIVTPTSAIENIITVAAIAILFGIRKFLLKSHDMVETPNGLVQVSKKTGKNV